jgi:hypothetical protein
VFTLITSRAIRHSLDQPPAGEEIKDLPDALARVELITGVSLALGRTLLIISSIFLVEAEELNVRQVEIGEVGDDIVGQLESLVLGGRGICGDVCCREDVGRGGI